MHRTPSLESLGFDPSSFHLSSAPAPQQPARVVAEHRGHLELIGADGGRTATLAGRLRHAIEHGGQPHPCVGDWVLMTPSDERHAVIHAVLPRRSCLWRRMAGSTEQTQVLVANVDVVCIVSALEGDVNPRRLERFLSLVLEGGAAPVIVLTKTDLCEDRERQLDVVREVAGTVPVHLVSALRNDGIDGLRAAVFAGNRSVALLGSSGVGKSTLINTWLGETAMGTGAVLDDGRGRHTTTHRQLFVVPGGGVVIDTPGLREVGVLDAESGISGAFSDVETLAADCRFGDCTHGSEPGCAVREAVGRGVLDAARVASFHALMREGAYARRRDDPGAERAHQRHARALQRALRTRLKLKRR